ncbi:MAG: hypothetical protein HGA54_06195, partial [Actinobacteria bacterium]|nr:hypothetical protein [Actinomycetota bacterium]
MVQSRKNHSDSVKKSSFEKRSDCRPTGLSPMDGQSKNTRKKIVLICLVIATVLAFAITFAYALGSGEPAVATADEERTVEEGQAKKEDASNRAYISDVIQEQLAKAQAAKEQAQSDSNVIAVQDQEETDAFAIWARGRFAVTDLSGDKLFFEVDPEEDYTGIWTSLGVGGGLVVKGASELSDVTASGSITTKRALIATDISSVQAIFGNLQSSEATFDDVVMVKSDAGSLTAKAAVIESLVATDASAQKFEVKTVGVESLIADSISTEDLIANSADLETLFCPLACIDDLEAGVLSAKDLDVENLVAGHVSAQTVS